MPGGLVLRPDLQHGVEQVVPVRIDVGGHQQLVTDDALDGVPASVDLRRDALDDDRAARAHCVLPRFCRFLPTGFGLVHEDGLGGWRNPGLAMAVRAVAMSRKPGCLRGHPAHSRTCRRHLRAQTLPHRPGVIRRPMQRPGGGGSSL